jgi:amino acid adenylation domain-containing protein
LDYPDYHPSASNLKELLETSAKIQADAVAIVHGDKQITYRQLNADANQLAFLLISKGIKPDDLVPVCLESGISLIVGLMGVIKAGAAYVPVDPDFPQDRIAYLLGDCGAKVVITAGTHRKKFNHSLAAEVIELDTGLTSAFAISNPAVVIAPENLAYVIYTSGTTGQPNGVMVAHNSVVNNLSWAKTYFNIGSKDKVLQKTTFCFDVSVWEIFWSLISGACLIIIGQEDYRDIKMLKQTIEMHQLSVVHFVPTMLELFLVELLPGECNCMRYVISSGEALTPFQANLFKKKLPIARLFNLYGPTETTIHSTYWEVPRLDGDIEKILIGKPINNTEILILNEKHEHLATGHIGEIYIDGAGVARGYLNKAPLTAERFILNPFNSDPNKRLFKTGDFGRYQPDGNIEYLGRIDEQVKVNGYRIELESIENNIKNSGLVKHAVVLANKNAKGFMQIVAYVKMEPNRKLYNLWDFLVTKLPGYMLPTTIHEVDEIPFTHNGKVDKQHLLEWHFTGGKASKSIAPQTQSEKIVYDIWKDLFDQELISVYDNFFDLGGNSIMALQLLSRIKKQTNIHLSFLLLNQYPTIESLAKLLARPKLIEIPNILISIKSGGDKPPLYLINAGGLVYGGFFNLSDELDPDQPVYGFQSNGFDKDGQQFKTIESIAATYVKSMINENANGPYCLAGYSLGGIIAFEMAKQLKSLGKKVKLLIMIDSLSRDPELIKTKYRLRTVLRMIGLNAYLFTQNPVRAVNYSAGVIRAAYKKIMKPYGDEPQILSEIPKDDNFDVFNLQVLAYQQYNLTPYDGNLAVLRAREITFYMDDFKYLGWKPFAKKIKSISLRGHHFSIFDNSNIKVFGGKLQTLADEGF